MDLEPFEATLAEYDGEPVYLPIKVNGEVVDKFKVNMSVSSMPLLEFGHAAKSGLDTQEMDGLAAMYDLIRDCIDDGEWDRFRECAKRYKLQSSDIFKITTTIWTAVANRPLPNGSGSQHGPRTLKRGRKSVSNVSEPSILSTELDTKKPANVKV